MATQKNTTTKQTQIKEKTVKNDATNNKDLMQTMEEMQKIIAEQSKIIQDLNNKVNSKKVDNVSVKTETAKIDGDYDVNITNLVDGEFTLSTLGFGNGTLYTFYGRGYQRDIPYHDLKDIVHNNRSFMESGMVYINDKSIVDKFKLNKYYKNMLKVDDFDKLKEMSYEELKKTLENLPKAESTSLNRGNEPCQFELAYQYIIKEIKEDKFPESLYPAVEAAYQSVIGRRINIREEIDFYKNSVMDAK